MVDSIKTPLDQRHLHVNDNSRHDTFTRNNATARVCVCVCIRVNAATCTISFNGK